MLLLSLIGFKKKTTLINVHKSVKYKARVTKNIVMTTNPIIMNLCKIFIQNKEPRIFMNPTIPTRNFENIDLFMDPQMAIPISTASHINHTQRSIQQSIFPIDFIFIGGSIIGTKKSRNMILKHRNKTKTSNQQTAIPVEIATDENAIDDCFHNVTEHTHDVMNDFDEFFVQIIIQSFS